MAAPYSRLVRVVSMSRDQLTHSSTGFLSHPNSILRISSRQNASRSRNRRRHPHCSGRRNDPAAGHDGAAGDEREDHAQPGKCPRRF